MKAWRLTKARHKSLDGIGGEIAEGRWHRRGQRIIYAAASPSLAVLEVLIHLDLSPDLLPDDYILIEIDIPDDIETIRTKRDDLPDGWDFFDGLAARVVGVKWLDDGETAVMLVPSVVVPEENIVLINPVHSHAGKIVEVSNRPFSFDPRLLTPRS